MSRTLHPEEKLIIDTLAEFKCLSHKQLIKSIYYKEPEVTEKIIRNLRIRSLIYESTPGYYSVRPDAEKDDHIIDAYWVFLRYINKVGVGQYYLSSLPSQINFIVTSKNSAGEIITPEFEIMSCSAEESYNVARLLPGNREVSANDENAIHYIIITRTKSDFKACLSRVPDNWKDKNLLLFGVLDYENPVEEGIPNIHLTKV